MGLVEALAVTLAPAIGKAVAKQWFKDSPIIAETAATILDLFKSKTTDVIAQRRAARQIEAIGERIAENLLSVFQAEGAIIDEGGQVAVAYAVAETIDKASIDSSLLAEKSLEPVVLAKYLLESNPLAITFFSAAETSLYERIIREVSQYIIDIASQLPRFNERTFGEMLKRQNVLTDVAEQILEEVRRIREEGKSDDVEASRFEVDYRRAVVRQLDELQLFGVDLSAASRRHRLSVAYVTLSVQKETTEPPDHRLVEKVGETLSEDNEQEESSAAPLPVDKALKDSNRVLILGDAGSGKTTLLQWIAVRAAQRDFSGPLSDWNDSAPFFIRLRQCVETGLPAPQDFPRFVSPALAGAMPSHWAHYQLNSGRAIVLIDGLDELGELKRADVRDWVRDLVGNYPCARFIISSRPHAVEENWLAKEGFTEAELLPMELPDIYSFIEHWHNAVREELQDIEEKAELEHLESNLKDVIRKKPQIRRLTTIPLLCAMVCALHRDSRRNLPSDRIELYEACFHMLIDRRDLVRGVDLRDYPNLSYRQKRALLQDLAYWLLRNGYSMIAVERAEERLAQKVESLQGLRRTIKANHVLRLFIERSGLLREPVKGQVDFTHRTFQEFLGAQTALDEGDLGFLIKSAHEQQWREVVILAAGLARPLERSNIIRDLIARGDNEPRYRQQLHLLGVACLETSIELDSTIIEEVILRLQSLVPPRTIKDAKSLALAGELALPFLESQGASGKVSAACVRALALIGGEAALQVLEGYKSDPREGVSTELTRGWDYFDRTEYARRVLCHDGRLRLKRPASLQGVESLDNVTALEIDLGYVLPDLTPVANLRNLSRARLWNAYLLKSLRPLLPLAGLEQLAAYFLYSLENIEDLVNFPNLTELTLFGSHKVMDWTPLSRLTSLTLLELPYARLLSNLEAISLLGNLTILELRGCENVIDLSPLSTLSKLTTLDISECLKLTNFEPLCAIASLKELRVSSGVLRSHKIPAELSGRVEIRAK